MKLIIAWTIAEFRLWARYNGIVNPANGHQYHLIVTDGIEGCMRGMYREYTKVHFTDMWWKGMHVSQILIYLDRELKRVEIPEGELKKFDNIYKRWSAFCTFRDMICEKLFFEEAPNRDDCLHLEKSLRQGEKAFTEFYSDFWTEIDQRDSVHKLASRRGTTDYRNYGTFGKSGFGLNSEVIDKERSES